MSLNNNNNLSFILLAAGIFIVFAADIFLPLGMAVSFGYIVLIIIAILRLPRNYTLILTGIASALVLIDIFFSNGNVTSIIIFNRFFAVLLLWLITLILLRMKAAEFELKEMEIKQREAITAATKESQARLAGIVSSAMDAIITINSRQEIILFNMAAEKMFGYKEEEVKGKHLGILIPYNERESHKGYVKKFGETGTTNRHMGALGAVRGLKRDGSEFPVEASISQMETSGHKLYTVILRDITERKIFEEQIKSSLKEKEILLKEIHHRVKNNLQVISSLLNLQSEYIKDDRVLDFVLESQNRIKSMALIHEKLYESKALSKIDLKSYIIELAENLLASYQPSRDEIKLILDLIPFEAEIDTGIDLGLIINELMTNCFKYAFPKDFTGEKIITIKLEANAEDKIKLIIKDTGIGMPEGFNIHKAESLGLQLVDILAQKLGGGLKFYVSGGSHFEIEIT